jgi:hypothetical protein
VEALLAGSVPNLISEDAVLEATLLGEERGADGGLLVCLELICDLGQRSGMRGDMEKTGDIRSEERRRTFPLLPHLKYRKDRFSIVQKDQVEHGRSERARPKERRTGRSRTTRERERERTEKNEFDLYGLVCRARSRVSHGMSR